MAVKVEVDGSETIGRLNRMKRTLHDAGVTAVAEATEFAEREARNLAPVDEGTLRDSIEGRASGLSGEVVAMARHAGFVERGTGSMSAQPYMAPAATLARQMLGEKLKALMGDV